MKIKYVFADGDVSEVEVSDEIGTVILDTERNEEALKKRTSRNCYPLYEFCNNQELSDYTTPESELFTNIENDELYDALKHITPLQLERLLKLADGMSVREIARSEGTDHKSVLESINRARKKIKKFL